MRRTLPRTRWLLGIVLFALVASGCGANSSADGNSWGGEAIEYFEHLAAAYSANDFYGVLDHYAPNVYVEKWRGDLQGGALVRDLLRWNSGDLGQEILALYLGSDGALTFTQWSTTDELSAVLSVMDSGFISAETVFDLGSTLDRGLRVSAEVLDRYETVFEDYARAWTDPTAAKLAALYAEDATIHDSLRGLQIRGLGGIIEAATNPRDVGLITTPGLGNSSDDARAVYLGPAEYGQDPQRAIGVYEVTDENGCVRRVAAVWEMNDGQIADERRYQEVEDFAECSEGNAPDGWWTGLELPPPRDQIVTNVLRTGDGRDVEIHNGTDRLEELVRVALERFAEANLDEPIFDGVTFEPSRSCQNLSGRLLQDASSRNIFMCFYEDEVCPGNQACEEPLLSVRTAVLHELAHAWMLDHVSSQTEQRVIEVAGLTTWLGTDVPWFERGVEYSAEVIAWGLLEQDAPMVRIGRPSCEELAAGFRLLTESEPLRGAGKCADV